MLEPDADTVVDPKQQAIDDAFLGSFHGGLVGSFLGGLAGIFLGAGSAHLGNLVLSGTGFLFGGAILGSAIVFLFRALGNSYRPWLRTFAWAISASLACVLGAQWVDEHAGWRFFHWAAMGILVGACQGVLCMPAHLANGNELTAHSRKAQAINEFLLALASAVRGSFPHRAGAITAGAMGGCLGGVVLPAMWGLAGWDMMEEAFGTPYVLIISGAALGAVFGAFGGSRAWTIRTTGSEHRGEANETALESSDPDRQV